MGTEVTGEFPSNSKETEIPWPQAGTQIPILLEGLETRLC